LATVPDLHSRFAGDHSLDDPPLRPLHTLDLKPLGGEVVERLADQMIGGEPHR
jgi:hypothetical protein